MADIVTVDGADAEMNAAIEEARRRFPEFRRALEEDWRRKIPVIFRALVKATFKSAATGRVEHMWVEVRNFEGDTIVGDLANKPNAIPELSEGDEVRVSLADISDWIYRTGNNTVGAFTAAVLERREQK